MNTAQRETQLIFQLFEGQGQNISTRDNDIVKCVLRGKVGEAQNFAQTTPHTVSLRRIADFIGHRKAKTCTFCDEIGVFIRISDV